MTRGTACLVLLAVLFVSPMARSDTDSPPEITVRVGFNGLYKVGVWTPVEVTVRGAGTAEQVCLTVPDGDGVPSRVSAPFPGDGRPVTLYTRFGRIRSELQVDLRRGGKVIPGEVLPGEFIARKTLQASDSPGSVWGGYFRPAIAATRTMILNLSGVPLGMEKTAEIDQATTAEKAFELLHQDEGRRTVVVMLSDCRQLPDRWYGYEGVDAVLLSTSRPEIFRHLKPDGPRIAALDEWIRMGGRLVFCVGSQGQEILAADAPLSRFAPGKFEKMVDLFQTRALEAYTDSRTPIPQPRGGGRLKLCVPRLSGVEGVVRAHELDLPLVVCTPRGLGQIVFVAADLDRAPLDGWAGKAALARRLLDLPTGALEQAGKRSAMMHYGYRDLSGQLRSALDQFSDVWRVPFWIVAAMIVVYVLLIGPVDYFLLRRFTRRMQWTWISFPGVVLAVSLAACCLAYSLKGDRVRINQVDLIDVDTVTGYVRGTSWANVFSPQNRSFHLSLRPHLPGGTDTQAQAAAGQPEVLFSWIGLPGNALGGMDPRTSNLVPWTESYDFSGRLDAMLGVPIQVASTKSFTARFHARGFAGVEAELTDDGFSLTGRIVNRLGFPLLHCILAYDRYAFDLGTIESGVLPGEGDLEPGDDKAALIDGNVKRSELKTILTKRKLKIDAPKGNYYQEITRYDRSSVALPSETVAWFDTEVLRAMMFYRAAGGQSYTELSNGYQRFVDLSSLLDTDRAILVAQAPAGRVGAELFDSGRSLAEQEDRHVIIYRFVLPVKRINPD